MSMMPCCGKGALYCFCETRKDYKQELLNEIVEDRELLEIARLAIEDTLIELRDSRIAMIGRGNGLVVHESDGTSSHLIRLGPEDGMRIGLKAIIKAITKG